MALKNTYAKLPAQNYINGGAIGIQYGYDNGLVVSLSFLLDLKSNKISFKLPVNWKKVQQILKNEGIGKGHDDAYAYRVSWAIMRDWVEAQMAILATETVTMPLFLPYAVDKTGVTLYEKVVESKLLLN